MQKFSLGRRPWQWRPPVRSRAIEWFCFATAAGLSLLFLLALLIQGRKYLAGGVHVALIVGLCLAMGYWNRTKRLRERAYRLLP